MLQSLKEFVRGTPLRRLARRSVRQLRVYRGSPEDIVDAKAFSVMRQVLQRDSNCIDVGCAQGLYLDEMLHLAPAGTHHAFEAIPELYKDLQRVYGMYSNVRLFNIAVTDSSGTTQFHHNVTNSGWSGIKRRDYPSLQDEIRKIEVPTNRLDTLVVPDLKIDFIKIDVEGAELLVLNGARNLLSQHKPVVIFEHGLGASDFYEAWPEKVFATLAECGLRVSTLDGYLDSSTSLSCEEFVWQFHNRVNFYFVAHSSMPGHRY